ncbi:MAG: hypothetical protein P3W94_008785 [Paracoccus sp. (in: a-proteobacteria)]|nr:hypothetical protein [Paracoccus sp. (in: a-proteobacteria)]
MDTGSRSTHHATALIGADEAGKTNLALLLGRMAAPMKPDPADRDQTRAWNIAYLPRCVLHVNHGHVRPRLAVCLATRRSLASSVLVSHRNRCGGGA